MNLKTSRRLSSTASILPFACAEAPFLRYPASKSLAYSLRTARYLVMGMAIWR